MSEGVKVSLLRENCPNLPLTHSSLRCFPLASHTRSITPSAMQCMQVSKQAWLHLNGSSSHHWWIRWSL